MSDIKDVLDSMEIVIDLRKVKSHATRAEMDRGLSSPQLKHGNDRADHYAEEGAMIYQVSDEDMNLVYMTDARTWRIQKRLLHISLQMSDGHHNSPKEKKPVPHTSPLNEALANLDHDIITGNDGWQECTKCCQRWHMRQRKSIIERGKCPGIPVCDPGPIPEIPRLAPKG